MKKTIIATALAAVLAVPAVSATEVYNENGNTIGINGKVSVAALKTSGNDTAMANNGSRIGFTFGHQLTDGWKATGEFQWGVNGTGDKAGINYTEGKFSADDAEVFSNRLANVGLHHDTYGSITFGKQWAAYYDVVAGTDEGKFWGASASGAYALNSGGINGTGRADNAIQYRNAFGDLSFAVQMQLQHEEATDLTTNNDASVKVGKLEYGNTYGASVKYAITDMLKVAAGANFGEYKATYTDTVAKTTHKADKTDSIYAIGATWGNYGDEGLYVAANWNNNKYHNEGVAGTLLPSANGVEVFGGYTFGKITPYAYYNLLDADAYKDAGTGINVTKYEMQYAAAGVRYDWDSNVNLWIEGKKDFSNIAISGVKQADDNGLAIGVEYNF